MGDLGNKINKIERAKRDKAALNRFLGRPPDWQPTPAPPPPVYLCLCGNSCQETELVAESGRTRFDPMKVYCRKCAPLDVLELCWPVSEQRAGESDGPPPPNAKALDS